VLIHINPYQSITSPSPTFRPFGALRHGRAIAADGIRGLGPHRNRWFTELNSMAIFYVKLPEGKLNE
jgi:hypothetical protein